MGAITGVVVFLFTGMPILAAGIAIAYALGEAPGWGRWIKLFDKDWTQEEYMRSHREPDRGKEIHKIANKISKESKDYKRYALTAMALRGTLWWLPVALVGTYLDGPLWLCTVLCGASMGPLCKLATKVNWGEHYWARQERLVGVSHGIALGVALGGPYLI